MLSPSNAGMQRGAGTVRYSIFSLGSDGRVAERRNSNHTTLACVPCMSLQLVQIP